MSQKTARERNRAAFPETAEFVDELREMFGDDQVKVIWVREGGVEMGRCPSCVDDRGEDGKA